MSFFQSKNLPEQYEDPATGLPASGFVLHAFLDGTSTPTNMFTDSTGTSAGTTITLDSGGFPSVSAARVTIWLDQSLTYKIELRDTTDVTVVFTATDIRSKLLATDFIKDHTNVADMVADTTVEAGLVIQTQGYTTSGDPGANLYLTRAVTGGADDGGSLIKSTGDTSLEFVGLFPGGVINAEQFGIDGVTDRTPMLNAFAFAAGSKTVHLKSNITIETALAATANSILRVSRGITITETGALTNVTIIYDTVSYARDTSGNVTLNNLTANGSISSLFVPKTSNLHPFENLVTSVITDATFDIDADRVWAESVNGKRDFIEIASINLTADNTVSGVNGLDTGSVANSTRYFSYVIIKSVPASTGTTTGTTTNKLIDSTADFVTDGIKVGDTLKNLTDTTTTFVTAVDSLTTLSVSDDIFVSGELYEVIATASLLSINPLVTGITMPTGYDHAALVGTPITDGTADFEAYSGKGNVVIGLDKNILQGGAATTLTSASISAAVPSIATQVYWRTQISATDGTTANAQIFAENDANTLILRVFCPGNVTSNTVTGGTSLSPITSTSTVFYKVTTAEDRLSFNIIGYRFD